MVDRSSDDALTSDRLSGLDWGAILFVPALMLFPLVFSFYSGTKAWAMFAGIYVFGLLIYVWPTRIALQGNSFHGVLRYFFALTAVPVFLAFFVLILRFVWSDLPGISESYTEARESGPTTSWLGHRIHHPEMRYVALVIIPASICFYLYYKCLAFLNHRLFERESDTR